MVGYVTSLPALARSLVNYRDDMAELSAYDDVIVADAKQALARANVFVAISDGKGGYIVGPVKHVGHTDMTLPYYSENRARMDDLRLNGSEAERHVRSLGGVEYGVGWSSGMSNHPAADAVRDFCLKFGKKPSAKARVRVFDITPAMAETKDWGEDRVNADDLPPVFTVLLAAIKAAQLPAGALEDLFSRAKADA